MTSSLSPARSNSLLQSPSQPSSSSSPPPPPPPPRPSRSLLQRQFQAYQDDHYVRLSTPSSLSAIGGGDLVSNPTISASILHQQQQQLQLQQQKQQQQHRYRHLLSPIQEDDEHYHHVHFSHSQSYNHAPAPNPYKLNDQIHVLSPPSTVLARSLTTTHPRTTASLNTTIHAAPVSSTLSQSLSSLHSLHRSASACEPGSSASSSNSSSPTPSPSRARPRIHSRNHHSHHSNSSSAPSASTSASISVLPSSVSASTAALTSSSVSLHATRVIPPDWDESIYRLSCDVVHIEHPNALGTTDDSGLSAEALRFRRFRCVYISRTMHSSAKRDLGGGPSSFMFRHIANSEFLALCRRKRCFRREFLPPRPPTSSNSSSNQTTTSSAAAAAAAAAAYRCGYFGVYGRGLKSSSSWMNGYVTDPVPIIAFLNRALDALRHAHAQYGDALMADVHLGFSRPISVDESFPHVPSIRDILARPAVRPCLSRPDSGAILLLAVSYRHVVIPRSAGSNRNNYSFISTPVNTANERAICISDAQWRATLRAARSLCRHVGASAFRLWTDRLLAARAPPGTMRWATASILPFTLFPVLYVPPLDHTAVVNDLRRMWLSVEHLAASFGQGIIVAGPPLPDDLRPPEWPPSYHIIPPPLDEDQSQTTNNPHPSGANPAAHESVAGRGNAPLGDAQRNMRLPAATWIGAARLDVVHVVRRVVGAIMCGLLRNKEVHFAHDAQALIEWASVLSSSVTYGDIAHTFSCDDCRKSMGFSSDIRVITLLSSALTVAPIITTTPTSTIPTLSNPSGNNIVVAADNDAYPRVSVPALRLSRNGRSWHGLREWVPEACLWGASEDECEDTIRSVADHTKVLLTSDGGSSAIAVLQLSVPDTAPDRFLVAYMLVGLSCAGRSRYHASVDWTKRFWPVEPFRMWTLFEALSRDTSDRDALASMAIIIGASSGIEYSEISNAYEVSRINLRRVRW